MTITAQRLLTELGASAWSGFNADDMVYSSEDSLQARTELNKALRYLLNLNLPFFNFPLSCVCKLFNI